MTITKKWFLSLALLFMLLISMRPADVSAAVNIVTIVGPEDSTLAERLAAKEIRRYLYLRTGELLPIVRSDGKLPSKGDLIIVGQKDRGVIQVLIDKDAALKAVVGSLGSQQYQLKTINFGKQRAVLIAGGDDVGTLYGAYRFIEHFGVRFYLHGDTIPDEKTVLKLPDVDEQGKSLFNLRGLLPFHDFPEGPDWWNADDYKAIIAQLAKLRMNFIGLHTYPEGGVGPEPTVWIGLTEDIAENSRVKFSYPSSYDSTLKGGNWGYARQKSSEFSFGGSQLFDRDAYAGEVMRGMAPWPKTAEDNNELFYRVGIMLNEAFQFAHALGVKSCVGTEIPLTIPKAVKERLTNKGKEPTDASVVQEIYEGMFRRIMRAYPLDYYWFWTPEGWTWGGAKDEQVAATEKDLLTAVAAAERVKAPFTLATCGWVLGPPEDRAQFDKVLPKKMPFSCINREVGKAPVEPQFAKVKGRPKWAIPWLEDDPGMISPQLWVGRMRKDAANALKYGCTGLMGIHWRTRILGLNVSALAQAAWDQSKWNKPIVEPASPKKPIEVIGGRQANFPNNAIGDTEDDPLYQNVRFDLQAYRFTVPNGKYTVKLQFCEPAHAEAGKRIFGVKLESRTVIDKLDMFGRVGQNKALDYTFDNVEVTDGQLDIDFVKVVEFPCIAAIVVEGEGVTRKINCGGGEYQDYVADVSSYQPPRFLLADDFYRDWALHQFGPQAAEQIAEIFTKVDGKLPEPSTWIHGPGGIVTNSRPWNEVAKAYSFVDKLTELEPLVKGAGNRARFDYWLNTFRYMKAMARVGCNLGELDKAMKHVNDEQHSELKRKLARDIALPLRKELVQHWGQMVNYLLATVSNTGEMGTVANLEQHSMKQLQLLSKHDKALEKALGEPLPADTRPWKDYRGPDHLIVPTVRTSLMAGEDLKLKVIILSANRPKGAAMYWRQMGKGTYNRISLTHIARSVYLVTLPAKQINDYDLEYYIKVNSDAGQDIYFPVTAPQINQTVVVGR